MAYERTTIGALQQWADQVNDTAYTYNNFAAYYSKSLNFTEPDNSKRAANSTPSYDPSSLGRGGPLNVGFSNYAQALSSWMAPAMESVGIPPITGFTSGYLNGSSWSISTLNHTTGIRDSSETSFLRAALGRNSFTVYVETLAERVLFNGTQATGVLVSSADSTYELSATKEVILSAGAFQSPHLLMVSGVGPSNLLGDYEIPIVSDMKGVGQSMNDHVYFGPSYRVNVQTASALAYGDNIYRANDEFNNDQNGILSNTGGDFLAYENYPADLSANLSNSTAQGGFPTIPVMEFFQPH